MPGRICRNRKISIDKIRIITGMIVVILKLYHEILSGGLKIFAVSARVSHMEDSTFLIKAVNPGYTRDHKSNVGEIVEIYVKGASTETPVALDGLAVYYAKSDNDEEVKILEFPVGSFAAGESIVLRLAGTEGDAHLVYAKQTGLFSGINMSGRVVLKLGEEVVDAVEWGDKKVYPAFKAANAAVLMRDVSTLEFNVTPESEYVLEFVAENYLAPETKVDESVETAVSSQCKGLIFSEILSYYAETQDEQFIELYNSTSEQMLLDGCMIKYKNKTYPLTGVIKADNYLVRWSKDFSLTKNPTNSNVLEIVDTTGEVVDKLEYPNGQKKGAAYAMIGFDGAGEEIWRTTYAVTPGEPNVYQEYKTCEEGKIINEATGNCVKVALLSEKTCEEGQYLNPLTGRCKKIASETTATECKEGYERNPDTGRCRKITENTGATYAITPETFEESSTFVGLYAVIIVVVLGTLYVIFEFRKEILKLVHKVFR